MDPAVGYIGTDNRCNAQQIHSRFTEGEDSQKVSCITEGEARRSAHPLPLPGDNPTTRCNALPRSHVFVILYHVTPHHNEQGASSRHRKQNEQQN